MDFSSLFQRGSDELLSQSGAVSNGAAMSPQPHHAADNNNDAKKVSDTGQYSFIEYCLVNPIFTIQILRRSLLSSKTEIISQQKLNSNDNNSRLNLRERKSFLLQYSQIKN